MFIGRKRELEHLQDIYLNKKFVFTFLYGVEELEKSVSYRILKKSGYTIAQIVSIYVSYVDLLILWLKSFFLLLS